MRIIIKSAFRSLARNKVRSFLTTLGIIIGVAAVIAMVAIGQGAGALVQEQIASLGTNAIAVMPGSSGRGGVRMGAGSVNTLVSKDAEAIEEDCPAASVASPLVRGCFQCVYGDQNWYTTVFGTTPSYLAVRCWGMASGSMFTDRDVRAAGKVCVIGKTVEDHLFPGVHPVGQTIRIKSMPFKVLGVLEARGQNALGQDQDDAVLIPLTSAQKKLLGITHLHMVIVSARSPSLIQVASDEITALLCQRHKMAPGAAPDFVLRTQLDLAEAARIASWILTALLLSVASVSLVVGGIGIMNIMLVTVTERTREIGIRRAIGARRQDILFQFLVEAVILSVLGGVLGVMVGIGSSVLVTYIVEWPTLVSPLSVLGAFLFSGAVGVFFGFYPARKASLLNPIDALRYE
jgi:putative ABC transport system permease protein